MLWSQQAVHCQFERNWQSIWTALLLQCGAPLHMQAQHFQTSGSRLWWSIPLWWKTPPTIQQPGFDLPRRYLALLNCFRTNQGQCASCQKMSGLAATDMCQTTSHIVNSCPQTKLEGGLQRMHSADDVATEWLNAFDSNNNFQTFLTTHRI